MDVWVTLVEVLATHSLDSAEAKNGDIITKAFAAADYNAVLGLAGYDAAFTTLKGLKRSIELIEARGDSVESEIRLSLRLLADEMAKPVAVVKASTIPPPNVVALQRFISEGMWKRWPKQQQIAFDVRAKVIIDWIDYFVSYTNRDAGATNNQFRKLITAVFGSFPPPPERTAVNYVARVIAKFLEGNNLRGFTDYKNIKCGDDIADQVRDHCQKAFSFTQVIEPESFKVPSAPAINWCYEEYKEFVKQPAELNAVQITPMRKIYTVISTKAINQLKPANLAAFSTWFDNIAGLKHVSLDGADREKLRNEIGEIAKGILDCKNATIEAVLAA